MLLPLLHFMRNWKMIEHLLCYGGFCATGMLMQWAKLNMQRKFMSEIRPTAVQWQTDAFNTQYPLHNTQTLYLAELVGHHSFRMFLFSFAFDCVCGASVTDMIPSHFRFSARENKNGFRVSSASMLFALVSALSFRCFISHSRSATHSIAIYVQLQMSCNPIFHLPIISFACKLNFDQPNRNIH